MERGGSSGNSSGSGSGNGTGNGTGNIGNGTGSGRAAPPGGAGRALLCLALSLSLLLSSPARALPSPARHRHLPAEPLGRSRDLLEAANASLQRLKDSRQDLAFECTLEEVDLEDITENQINTIKACTAQDPGPGNCPVLERSTFDKGKCLQGISEDLRAYRAQLRNLNDTQVLAALDGMMEALGSSTGKVPEAPAGLEPGSEPGLEPGSERRLGSVPFPERLRLCSVLQAFRIRSVTICRVLSFLSAL